MTETPEAGLGLELSAALGDRLRRNELAHVRREHRRGQANRAMARRGTILARDYQVEPEEQAGTSCIQCAEMMAAAGFENEARLK